MTKDQLEKFKVWLYGYAGGFRGDDEFINANLELKIEHTGYVCGEMRYLAEQLGLDENDSLIAETVALFHDVGRFPQFAKYRTYVDTKSINHNELALEVLREKQILNVLDDHERKMIFTAIKFHGVKQLPTDLDGDSVIFARLIRDADKLDIYRVVTDGYKKYHSDPDGFPLEVEFDDKPYCSKDVVQAAVNCQRIDYKALRTLNDAKLLQLGWVFDVFFLPTFRRIREKKYLEKILAFLPETDEIKKVEKAVFEYVDSRLVNG